MPSPNLFLIDQNAESQRHAVVEDDGKVAVLYLTAPQSTTIVASAWIYGRGEYPDIPAPSPGAAEAVQPNPGAYRDPVGNEWTLRWSPDGHSVAVVANGLPLACILAAANPGYSRGLRFPNPLGRVWDEGKFASNFGTG